MTLCEGTAPHTKLVCFVSDKFSSADQSWAWDPPTTEDFLLLPFASPPTLSPWAISAELLAFSHFVVDIALINVSIPQVRPVILVPA